MTEELPQLDDAHRQFEAFILAGLEPQLVFPCEGEIGCPNPGIFAAVCVTCRDVVLWCGSHFKVKVTLHSAGYPLVCKSGHTAARFTDVVTIHPVHLKEGRVA